MQEEELEQRQKEQEENMVQAYMRQFAGDERTAEAGACGTKKNRGYGAVMIPGISPVDYEILEVCKWSRMLMSKIAVSLVFARLLEIPLMWFMCISVLRRRLWRGKLRG